MHFASDNWAGAHPRISENLSRHAGGFAMAYGGSELDRKVGRKFNEIFEREVAVFFVATGTAANSLGLTAVGRPGGVVFAHSEAHVIADECGAMEYLSGGMRLGPVDGALGRLDPAQLAERIADLDLDPLHGGRPAAVTITQATEIGTLYSLAQIDAVADICRRRGLPLHMDGARLANALVSLNATPAEMTWKRGVDMVSFGGTKNGCWCAEALVVLDASKAEEMPFIRKRAAQLFSKSRFIAAQFEAYLDGGLWLETASHANGMAARLADRIRASAVMRLAWEPEANEVFAIMPKPLVAPLQAQGAVFYPWKTPRSFAGQLADGEALCRFVTSFATAPEEIDRFGALIALKAA